MQRLTIYPYERSSGSSILPENCLKLVFWAHSVRSLGSFLRFASILKVGCSISLANRVLASEGRMWGARSMLKARCDNCFTSLDWCKPVTDSLKERKHRRLRLRQHFTHCSTQKSDLCMESLSGWLVFIPITSQNRHLGRIPDSFVIHNSRF